LSRHLGDAFLWTPGLKQVDWVLGAAMLIRGSALLALEGFDDRYFLYCEDVDFCARAWALGFEVLYCSDVAFRHDYQRQSRHTLSFRSKATRAHWRSTMRLARSYPRNYLGRPLRPEPGELVPSVNLENARPRHNQRV
jgi:N-acetylglucosaminyl-diphospho-decaprenol L-rhamnosyltransferase